jgi:hypothetical protein
MKTIQLFVHVLNDAGSSGLRNAPRANVVFSRHHDGSRGHRSPSSPVSNNGKCPKTRLISGLLIGEAWLFGRTWFQDVPKNTAQLTDATEVA